jgi:hypothetical protein
MQMDILDLCAQIVIDHEVHVRADVVQRGQREIAETLTLLSLAGRLPVVAADREWLSSFLLERPDRRWKVPEFNPFLFEAILQGVVTQEEVEAWIDEALSRFSFAPALLPDLPEREPGDCWVGVEIGEQLYCCGCRSLFEGVPLSEGDMNGLKESQVAYCADCGIDL